MFPSITIAAGRQTGWQSTSKHSKKTHIVPNVTLARATKGLNGEYLALFHLSLIASFDDRYALPAMDAVLLDAMSIEVPNAFHWERSPPDLDLIALHHFLDRAADVAHANVDARLLCQVKTCSISPRRQEC